MVSVTEALAGHRLPTFAVTTSPETVGVTPDTEVQAETR